MKISNLGLKLFTAVLFGTIIVSAHATDRYKANNTTALNLAGSWTNGLPAATDLAIFDSTLDATPKSYALGGNLTVNGISFRDAQSAQTITATTSSTLTLANGSPGIDLTSAATNDLTISCLMNLGTSGGQTFNVANSDRLLLVNAQISGTGPLKKTGTGTFKSSYNNHQYTGGTIISGGTLQLGVNNALAAGNIIVTNGGTLDLNKLPLTNKLNYVVHISGTGVGGGGALVNNGGQLNYSVTNLVLDGDATVGANTRFDIRPTGSTPLVDLAGHTLTLIGGSQLWFQQLLVTSGNIVVQNGTFGLNATIYTNSGSLTIKAGNAMNFFRNGASAASTVTTPIAWEAGSVVTLGGTDTTDPIDQSVGSTISLAGDTTVSVTAAGAVLELAGGISGVGGIIKSGSGSLLLSGADTYSGDTTVNAGVLTLKSAWKASGSVTVSDGGSIEFQPAVQDAIVGLNNLTLGSAGNTTVNFNMGGFANPSGTVANVTNAITLNGTTTINLAGTTGLTGGTFKLFTFGSIAGSGGFAVGVTPGFTATLATNGNSIEITLEAATLSWRGTAAGTWQVSTPGNLDWYNLLLAAPAGFVNGLPVIFDESGSAQPNVSITETVQPASITVSNMSTTYTFSAGGGKISGSTGLTKTGAGTLNLGTANDYTGPTIVKQGTLQLGTVYAIPTNTIALTVTNSGTLDLNGNNQTVIGLNGNGTVSNSSPTAAELRFGPGSAGSFSGVIADSGTANLTLYKTGAGYQTLTGNNTFSGGTTMNGGSLFLGSNGALGSGPVSLSFTAQIASDSSTARSFANGLNFSGSSTKNIGDVVNNGVLTFSGAVGFSAGSRSVSFNSDVIFNGTIGTGSLVKEGAGKLTMDGVNTCDATTINGGTLAGSGSFSGPVAVNGATLSPGTTGLGILTINNNLTLNGTSTTVMELNATTSTNDVVQGLAQITYGGTLQVNNLAGTPALGQSFKLFSATTVANKFAVTNLPALTGGLAWNWDRTNGTLTVVPAVAMNPTNITFSVSGGSLNLTWPGDHLGWIAQSNAVTLTDTNYWFDIPGSGAVTNLAIPLDASLTNVFYRLRSP